MNKQRRHFLELAGVGSATLWHSKIAVASADTAGLDPFSTYGRMFASTREGAECAWWFMGALPLQVEDIGAVDFVQEETIRVHRVEVPGPGQLDILWREVGVFRDITSGAVPTGWYNPIKGALQPQTGQLKGGPSRHLIRKRGDELEIALQVKNTTASRITIDGRVSGDRVCLTHIEEKSRSDKNGAAPSVIRTVFKIYASLADLRGTDAAVNASGFYGVRNRTTGNVFVNGLMQKAQLDEKVNPLAWERAQARYPEFFQGDRLAPSWQDG
jgi:hypothetical protein